MLVDNSLVMSLLLAVARSVGVVGYFQPSVLGGRSNLNLIKSNIDDNSELSIQNSHSICHSNNLYMVQW